MIKALYEKLNSSEFLVPGGISYNFYILPYDVRNEAKVISDINNVLKDLKRPADYIDVLVVDLFQVFTMGESSSPVVFKKAFPSLKSISSYPW